MAAVRLSWQHVNFIWIVVVSVVVVDAAHCNYKQVCSRSTEKILVLKANRTDDWENCNWKRECNNKEQAGSFECKCELNRASHTDICGRGVNIPDSKEIFIHNKDYPKKNSQTDPCECVIIFKQSGGFPNVSLSHIELPSGSDSAVYISDGSVIRDKTTCKAEPINCELFHMSSKNGTLEVVSKRQIEKGRFWIRVSAQMGMNATCRIKNKIEPTKECKTELTSTLDPNTSPIGAKEENMPETAGNSLGKAKPPSTMDPRTTEDKDEEDKDETTVNSSVSIACAAAGVVSVVVAVIICGVRCHKRAKHARKERAETETGLPLTGIMQDNRIHESDCRSQDGAIMKDNDIYESSGSATGDKNVGYPMKDNDIYESSGSATGDKNVGYPMKDNDIYQPADMSQGGKSHDYPMGIMKENDIYQSTDLCPVFDRATGAPMKVTCIYELEGQPRNQASGYPLNDNVYELHNMPQDVGVGHGCPLEENAYELADDQGSSSM